MKVLITSGGTIEKIDTVRSISNMSTGRLGCLIADRFAKEADIDKIFYVCSKTAVKPESDKAEIIPVESVMDLENAIKEVINNNCDIDIIVHGMAVSDYRVKSVTSTALLAGSIVSNLEKIRLMDKDAANSAISTLIQNPKSIIDGGGKISSDVDDMMLLMEKTPKIISFFKSLSPKSILVGFKLLDNVTHEILIDRGFKILTENKCSFVLANDLRDITEKKHTGYLIDRQKKYSQYSNKAEIADAIVSATMQERMKKP